MAKIELPPKVKCWKCVRGIIEKVKGEHSIPQELCDCDDGYRYDFDDLAAAIEKQPAIFYEQTGPHPTAVGIEKYRAKFYMPSGRLTAGGDTPTAALLAAILKHNEACDAD